MSGEVCLNVKLSGGRQLSVSKDGSQLTARATWANNQIESGPGVCHFWLENTVRGVCLTKWGKFATYWVKIG